MDDQEFQTYSGEALHDLYKRLNAASDGGEFEADFNAGALAIEFEEPPAKFVVSPNAPVEPDLGFGPFEELQAGLGPARQEFVLAGTGAVAGPTDRATPSGSSSGQEVKSVRCPASTSPIRFARRSAPTATSRRECFRANWSRDMWKPCAPNFANTDWPWTPETVYLGGGTPSQMEPGCAWRHCSPRSQAASGRRRPWKPRPARITREKARAWRRAGINRVSLGVQSFIDKRTGAHRPQAHGGNRRAATSPCCAPRASRTSIST